MQIRQNKHIRRKMLSTKKHLKGPLPWEEPPEGMAVFSSLFIILFPSYDFCSPYVSLLSVFLFSA